MDRQQQQQQQQQHQSQTQQRTIGVSFNNLEIPPSIIIEVSWWFLIEIFILIVAFLAGGSSSYVRRYQFRSAGKLIFYNFLKFRFFL